MLEIAPSCGIAIYHPGNAVTGSRFEDEVKESIERLAQDSRTEKWENLIARILRQSAGS